MNTRVLGLLIFALLSLHTLPTLVVTSVGFTLTSPIQMTSDIGPDEVPAITRLSNGSLVTVWTALGSSATRDIYASKYDGAGWSTPSPLVVLPSHDKSPAVTQSNDGKVWIFWDSDRDVGGGCYIKPPSSQSADCNIWYRVYDGPSLVQEAKLSTTTWWEGNSAALTTSTGEIWLAFQSNQTGKFDIFLTTYNGISWSSPEQLTTDPGDDIMPALAEGPDGTVWLVWASRRGTDPDFQIFYRTHNGVWTSDKQLTTHPSENTAPTVEVQKDGSVWIFWTTDRNCVIVNSRCDKDPGGEVVFQNDLYYSISRNMGVTWSGDLQLTTDQSIDDVSPSMVEAGVGYLALVWQKPTVSVSGKNWDIYSQFIRVNDGAVKSLSSPYTIYYRGETVPITVVLENQGWEPENLSFTLLVNETVIATENIGLVSGASQTLSQSWSTAEKTPGKYVIRAQLAGVPREEDFTDNILLNTIEVKIPGDVNGDRVVNVIDLAAIGLAFLATPGDSRYSLLVDLNRDGIVNVVDLSIVGLNFLSTA